MKDPGRERFGMNVAEFDIDSGGAGLQFATGIPSVQFGISVGPDRGGVIGQAGSAESGVEILGCDGLGLRPKRGRGRINLIGALAGLGRWNIGSGPASCGDGIGQVIEQEERHGKGVDVGGGGIAGIVLESEGNLPDLINEQIAVGSRGESGSGLGELSEVNESEPAAFEGFGG